MAGEHYTDTSGILINHKIIASALKTIIQTLDEKIYSILTGAVAHAYMRLGDFSDVSIVTGVVTVTGMSQTLVSETGTTDSVDTINISPTGIQIVVIRAKAGHTITLNHNTGNLKFASGTNLVVQDDKRLVMYGDGGTLYDTYTSTAGGGGGGGVSSVGLTLPAIFSVSGSPVTSSGTLAGTLATQLANLIWAGPSSGGAATPTFRAMVLADMAVIATNRLLGRSTAGSGVPEEISIGSGLTLSGGILSASGGGAGDGGSAGNIITNGDFTVWERGISAAPDNWVLTGSGATIAQEGTIKKHGDFSAKVTRVGNDCHFSQDVYNKGGKTYMQGRTYVFGAWVYATVASRVRLRMNDGTTTTYSSYHSGGSGWEWLTVTATIAGGATSVQFGLAVDTGNTAGYIDSATVAEGSALTYPIQPANNVNQYQRRAIMWHDEALVVAGLPLAYIVDTTQAYNFTYGNNASSAQNDAFTHSFYLQAGTYTFSVLGITSTNRAKCDWYLDGVLIPTATGQDWYSASAAKNVVKTASVTVVGDGYHVLKGIAATRNASNTTGWVLSFTKYWFAPSSD